MKCDLENCKKVIDDIVFNNDEVKELISKGWIKPESTIKNDYVIKGQACIFYHYRFFGDFWTTSNTLNSNIDDEFLFGFSGDDALVKAANRIIYDVVHHCSLKYRKEYDDAIEREYSEPYISGRYNGD